MQARCGSDPTAECVIWGRPRISELTLTDERWFCPLPSQGHLRQQCLDITGGDRPQPRLLAEADGERQLPARLAEIESLVEHAGRRGGRIRGVSRRHGLAP